MRILTLVGITCLLVLTAVLGLDVGVASPVPGIVTYVGMLEKTGALKECQEGVEGWATVPSLP